MEQGTRYQEKWVVSGDIILSLTHLKYFRQLTSSHGASLQTQARGGRNDFLLLPKGAERQYLVPSSFGNAGSIKCGGNSDLMSLLNSVKVHATNREYSLL